MTGGIVAPVLPEMLAQLQFDPQWAGTLVSIHALAIALFTPVFGIIADRIGKLKVLIPALIIYSIFGVAGAFIPHLGPLLAARVGLGVSSAGIAAASIGLLGTMYDGEARTRILGYATSAMTTASILIPLVGGWVGSFDWHYAFYLYGFGVPTAIASVLILREGRSKSSSMVDTSQNKQLLSVIRQGSVLKLYLTIALAAAIVYTVVIYTPLYLKEVIGAGPALNGFVLAIRAVGAALVSAFVASRLAKRIGSDRTIGLGFVLMALMLATIPLLDELRWIVPAAVLFGMGFGVTVPNIYDALAQLSPAGVRSSVLAIGTGANSLGQFMVPIVLGALDPLWNTIGLAFVFYAAAGVALTLGILIGAQHTLSIGNNQK
ncbi:MAG: MFS transporter [Leptolyngbyaceae bacterium]|nr:MFS transporter [Leptolyngbyaceae bacterium]